MNSLRFQEVEVSFWNFLIISCVSVILVHKRKDLVLILELSLEVLNHESYIY